MPNPALTLLTLGTSYAILQYSRTTPTASLLYKCNIKHIFLPFPYRWYSIALFDWFAFAPTFRYFSLPQSNRHSSQRPWDDRIGRQNGAPPTVTAQRAHQMFRSAIPIVAWRIVRGHTPHTGIGATMDRSRWNSHRAVPLRTAPVRANVSGFQTLQDRMAWRLGQRQRSE